MANVGYLTIGTNNLEQALGFYDQLFAVVGGKRGMQTPKGQAYVIGAGPMIMVTATYDGAPATVGNGSMVAIMVDNKDQVAEMHAKALELGGTCEGEAGPRGSFGTFSYFRDLDGNKLAAFVMGQ
jgi:catechol 2,3-dioxygenase-like lactoylglutathione lyase family enzyme